MFPAQHLFGLLGGKERLVATQVSFYRHIRKVFSDQLLGRCVLRGVWRDNVENLMAGKVAFCDSL